MPAEVYSISGAFAGDGQCPEGWAVTPAGNCGAPMGNCPPKFMTRHKACRDPRALLLQNALFSLGRTVGDQELAALAVDGFVGPKTTAAVNKAFTTHVGPGQAGADLRSGTLSQADVAANAQQLAQILTGEIQRRGGQLTQKPPKTPAPGDVDVDIGPAQIEPRAGTPLAVWALLGLNALTLGVGLYGAFRRPKVGAAVDLPSNIVPFPEAV